MTCIYCDGGMDRVVCCFLKGAGLVGLSLGSGSHGGLTSSRHATKYFPGALEAVPGRDGLDHSLVIEPLFGSFDLLGYNLAGHFSTNYSRAPIAHSSQRKPIHGSLRFPLYILSE